MLDWLAGKDSKFIEVATVLFGSPWVALMSGGHFSGVNKAKKKKRLREINLNERKTQLLMVLEGGGVGQLTASL